MLVTLPFVLLLLDHWPLKRIHFGKPGNWQLLFEKVPLFAFSAASSIVTCIFQESGKLVASLAHVSISVRIENALVSYVTYIYKMLWPFNLAVLYPHPQSLPWWKVAGACLLVASAFFLTIRLWRRHPYISVGWLWYMGTLVPVIGLVQVGAQSMADRYTYVPLIGLFIAVAWGAPELVARWRHKKIALTITAITLLSILATATVFQLRYWADSTKLLEHTLRVTSNNWLTHYNLGAIMAEQGKAAKAAMHFSETLRINPNIEEAHFNLGVIKAHHGMTTQAINHFSEAIRINPGLWEAHYHQGVALNKMGRTNDAIRHFSKTLQINPGSAETHNNIGSALIKIGRTNDAIKHFLEALRINPAYAKPHYNLGIVLANEGRFSEAIRHFSDSLRLNPGDAEAHNILGGILLNQGRITEAISHFSEAVRINPRDVKAQTNLKTALSVQNRQ
jgi:tetratricopeptide (TPR) repeat protein